MDITCANVALPNMHSFQMRAFNSYQFLLHLPAPCQGAGSSLLTCEVIVILNYVGICVVEKLLQGPKKVLHRLSPLEACT
jgi:hypothetical protein